METRAVRFSPIIRSDTGGMSKKLPLLLVLIAFALVPSDSDAQVTGGPSWWNESWEYRLVVGVVPQGQRGGINVARVNMGEQSELCLPDGSDIRVLDSLGRILPCEVKLKNNQTLDVRFFVPPDVETFYIYYGNSEAEQIEYVWPGREEGGLTLETGPVNKPVYKSDQLPEMIERGTAFDKQPWAQIHDVENPFGRDDLYMSVYEGVIYCPEDGEYVFAVNADDVASFELKNAGGRLCWRDAGAPSERWQSPGHPHATRRVDLQKGVYRFVFHHVENWGSQFAALGWKKPSSDAIVTVSPEAFVTYLPADILGRDVHDQKLAPFFVAQHDYNLMVNTHDFKFPVYRFESRLHRPDDDLSHWTYQWDLGDGSTASGRQVKHEFGAGETYQVSLTVRDELGRTATITRPISPPAEPVKRVQLQMEVESEKEMVRQKERIEYSVLLRNRSSLRRDPVLKTEQVRGRGEDEQRSSHSMELRNLEPTLKGEGGWLRLNRTLPPPSENLSVTLSLMLHERAVVEKEIAFKRTDRPLGDLYLGPSQQLREERGDAKDRLVVLVLADVKASEAPERKLCEPSTGDVQVLVFDEGLAGPRGRERGENYLTMLKKLLEHSYSGLTFNIERRTTGKSGQDLPIRVFVETYREVIASRPNLVLLVCQPEAVINGIPVGAFEDALIASLDQVLSQSKSAVVLLTPPPLPQRADLSRSYARVVKRIGLSKGIPVVDLYSRFLLTDRWRSLFRPGSGRQQSFLLYPNLRGQRRVARETYESIVDQLHLELSAAVRKTDYMNQASR